ncbi:MAG: AtpZ/AtpI family protein [Bacteroidota bacterium]
MIDSGNKEEGKQANNFAKYTGVAFQMFATIGLFTFIGYKIDSYRTHKQPIYTAILGLLGVIVSLYMVVRSLTKK